MMESTGLKKIFPVAATCTVNPILSRVFSQYPKLRSRSPRYQRPLSTKSLQLSPRIPAGQPALEKDQACLRSI